MDTFTLPPEVTQSGSDAAPTPASTSQSTTAPTPGQSSGTFTLPASVTATGSDSNFSLPDNVATTGSDSPQALQSAQSLNSFDSTPDDKLVNGPFSPAQFYNENKNNLTPDQYNRLVNIYKSRQESGYTLAGAGNAATGALGALKQTGKDAVSTLGEFARAGMTADMLKNVALDDVLHNQDPGQTYWGLVKKLATKEGGEALSGVENMATDMGNLVRTGIKAGVNQTGYRSAIQTVANAIGKPAEGQALSTAVFGPRENADVLSPTTFGGATDWSAELQRDAAVQDQLQKTEEGNGAMLKGMGLDPDTVAKEGVTYNPSAIRTISFASNPLNYVPALGGLKVAGTIVRDAAGNVVARAATEDAAKAFVQKAQNAAAGVLKGTTGAASKALNVTGNVVGLPSDVASTFFKNALSREGGRGVLAGLGKSLDNLTDAVKTQGVTGAVRNYLTQPFSVADTVKNFTYGSLDDILGYVTGGHAVGTGLLASGAGKAVLQGAAKGVAKVGELGANAIQSDAANALIRGAGTGAAYMAPIAAAQTDPQDQMQSLMTGAMFGAGGTAFGMGLGKAGAMSRQAGARAAQIFNSNVFKNLDGGNVEPVRLNVPGLDNLEDATQKNIQSLGPQASQFNLLRALLNPDAATGQTSTAAQSPRQPLYLLTPQEMAAVDPRMENQNGVANTVINGQRVTLVTLRDGKMPALSHEVAHSFVDHFAQTDPEGFQAAINSISPDVREQFKQQYLNRSGAQSLPADVRANMETPDYQNREIMSEIFSRYLSGEALKLPTTAMQSIGMAAGNLLGSLGIDGTHMAERGTPGASESMGLVPGFSAQKIARGSIKQMLADPAIQGTLKAVRVPPRLQAQGPAAVPPVLSPTAPAPATSPVTPAHQDFVNRMNAFHPGIGKKYQAVLDKVQRGEALTPSEQTHWNTIDSNANPPATQAGNPAATPAAVPNPTASPANPVSPAAPVAPAPEVPPAAPAPAPTPAPAPIQPSVAAPESLRNKPADFNKFTGATRQPALDRVQTVLDAVANDKNLAPEQKQAVTQLLNNLRTPHDVVYNAAKEESGTGRKGRRADIEEARNNPDLRAAASKLASIPLDARVLKNGESQVQMWSGDKVLSNIEEAVKRITSAGQEKAIPYELKNGKLTEAGMAELASDLQKYGENQDNGFRGDGKELERPANAKGFIPDENPNYKPQTISSQRADFLNMLMGEAPPKTARVNEGVVPIQARAKELATANKHSGEVIQPAKRYKEPYQDVTISDYNPLRARLRKAGVDLSDLTEAHEWVNAKDIKSATPRPDIKLSPTATDVTAAGFMPESREIELTGPKGEKYPARFDGYQDFTKLGRGRVAQITPMVDIPGVIKGRSTTYAPALEKAGIQIPPLENFMPNDEVREHAAGYMEAAGLPYNPHTGYEPVNETRAKGIADFYQNAKHEPANPAVKKSYDAFVNETKAQWDYITSHGVKMEPWTKEGQPYKNSAEMTSDIRDNRHLWYFPSEEGFGHDATSGELKGSNHPLLAKSGVLVKGKDVPVNDLFRAVHDYFGHAKEGYEFGPRGEYNAYLAHSRMYSEAARPAMAAETLGQNSWVNFGPHLRNAEGNIPKKGEPGYVHPSQRPFAEQKATILPQELHSEQLMPAHDENKEHILQAAIELPDGRRFSGSAHYFAQQNAESAGVPDSEIVKAKEGFLTSSGRFVDRDEAYQIASSAKQIDHGVFDKENAQNRSIGSSIEPEQLESVAFNRSRQFMPYGGRDEIRPERKPKAITLEELTKKNPLIASLGDLPDIDTDTDYSKYETKPRVNAPGKLTAWVLPNGKVRPLQTAHHEEDLSKNHAEYNKQFGTTFGPNETDSSRLPALNAGFTRVRNYNGRTTVEVNSKFWPKQRAAIEQHLLNHADDMDHLTVNVLNDKGDEVSGAYAKLFDSEDPQGDIEKAISSIDVPEVAGGGARRGGPTLIQKARAIPGPGELERFMPATQEDLFKGTKKLENNVREMTPEALAKQFPEIIKPKLRPNGDKEPIPYDFSNAPLVKKYKTEDEKVAAYGDALANDAHKWEASPEFQSGLRWYSDFVPKLKKWFGKDAPLFAELLAATSPRTNPTVNFGYAADAFEGWLKGNFDKHIAKYQEGLKKLNEGSLRDWYDKTVPAKGRNAKPKPSDLLGAWVAAHNLTPTRLNAAGEAKNFGLHGISVLKVLTRTWVDMNTGPKVRQFVGNLKGEDNGATIDVWASRTLHRLGYDSAKRWRILPEQESPLPDPEFAFGQKVFAAAAKKLGVTPDALQGGMWFAEKKLWADKGWQELNLGDYRAELEKFVHRRKLNAARTGVDEDIIPINRVQSRALAPADIRSLTAEKHTPELFDIQHK